MNKSWTGSVAQNKLVKFEWAAMELREAEFATVTFYARVPKPIAVPPMTNETNQTSSVPDKKKE
jgi:hypothetical protein